MKQEKTYTKEELQEICDKCFSYRQLALALGYSENSIDSIKKIIHEYNIDTNHFKEQGWNKDNIDISIFQYNKSSKSDTLIRALTILRGWRCEKCGRTEWEGQKIPLCVHHIDGNHINNVLDNLQILCPNCHAQTDNYCGKNKGENKRPPLTDEQFLDALKNTTSIRQALQKVGINYAAKYYYDKAHELIDRYGIVQKPKKERKPKTRQHKKQKICVDCGKPVHTDAKRCSECEHKQQRKTDWPQRDELKQLIRKETFTSIGRQFGVSDNAVRKWCKNYNLPFTKTIIKSYSDEEWLEV
jgi:hypothetical protein